MNYGIVKYNSCKISEEADEASNSSGDNEIYTMDFDITLLKVVSIDKHRVCALVQHDMDTNELMRSNSNVTLMRSYVFDMDKCMWSLTSPVPYNTNRFIMQGYTKREIWMIVSELQTRQANKPPQHVYLLSHLRFANFDRTIFETAAANRCSLLQFSGNYNKIANVTIETDS